MDFNRVDDIHMESVIINLTLNDVSDLSSKNVVGSSLASFSSSSSLQDMDDYLEINLGPRRLPYSNLIPLTVIYCVIFFTGFAGNSVTCLVILKNQYMQTATNFYLLNLAIADMLILLTGKCSCIFFSYFLVWDFIDVFFECPPPTHTQ